MTGLDHAGPLGQQVPAAAADPVGIRRRKPQAVWRRPAVATAVILLFLGGFRVVEAVQVRQGKVSPAVVEALDRNALDSIVVTLDFPLEPFHLAFLQRRGTIMNVDGSSVTMRRVTPENVRELEAQYWIRAIDAVGSSGNQDG
jgi:hypothetical protein